VKEGGGSEAFGTKKAESSKKARAEDKRERGGGR